MNIDLEYDKYKNVFNNALSKHLETLNDNTPSLIRDAMVYAVKGGGKRIRPVLALATADMLGVSNEKVMKYALAIEYIQSYSLVHDDLPAMDNDDYRRGQLSTHKKFGEAYGILCGDALLNLAYETCLDDINFDISDAKATKIIANYAGYIGMISGQVLDLQNENNDNPDEKLLYEIYDKKTAMLLSAPILAVSALANNAYFDLLSEYGKNLGEMFQITDDIIDEEGDFASIGKTPHKDKEENKVTAVKIFGINEAKKRAEYHYKKCIECLSNIPKSEFLIGLTEKIYLRKK